MKFSFAYIYILGCHLHMYMKFPFLCIYNFYFIQMPVTWQNDYNTEHDARIVDNVGKFRLNSPTLVHLHIWYNLWINDLQGP